MKVETNKFIDLGGGNNPCKDATLIVDLINNQSEKPFMKHDLNKLPLPFKDNSVNHFKFDNVLEHLEVPPEAILKDILRCLEIGGTMEIAVPNTLFWIYRLEYLLGRIPTDFQRTHLKHFTFTAIECTLTNSGFKISTSGNWRSFIPLRNIYTGTIRFNCYKEPKRRKR